MPPPWVVSSPINDMFGITVGYTRGADDNDNYDECVQRFPETPSIMQTRTTWTWLSWLFPVTLDGFCHYSILCLCMESVKMPILQASRVFRMATKTDGSWR
jgi:hypothetical protein